MPTIPSRLVFAFVLLLGTTARAADLHDVLVPIPVHPIAGANGSRWVAEFFVRNSGVEPVCLVGVVIPACDNGLLTERFDGVLPAPAILTYAGPIENMQFSLRTWDSTRKDATFGAEVPVVPLEEFAQDQLELINVPTHSGFRRNLRIYSASPEPITIRIRVWDHRADLSRHSGGEPVMLGERTVTLTPTEWWISIGNFDELLPASSTDRVRIQVERISGTGWFWTFMTLTNDATHHVTIASPQR